MAADLVRIAKIGEKTHSDKTSRDLRVFDDEFFYNHSQYKLLIEIDIARVLKGMFNIHIVVVVSLLYIVTAVMHVYSCIWLMLFLCSMLDPFNYI